jgi:hypothetical protein
MHIIKLIFEHDIPLNRMDQSPAERRESSKAMSLEDFMRPEPIFSKFYLSSTLMGEEPEFGLNKLEGIDKPLQELGERLGRPEWISGTNRFNSLLDAIKGTEIGHSIIAPTESSRSLPIILPTRNTADPELVSTLYELLKQDTIVMFKEVAHHGWDLQIYSLKNSYPAFFYSLKTQLSPEHRLFSMNGKRIRSERLFYFETWSLENPPHGIEEVFENTEI